MAQLKKRNSRPNTSIEQSKTGWASSQQLKHESEFR